MNVEEEPTRDRPTPEGLVVERAQESDVERVKAVRLAALADSPSAFGSTLAEERKYDEADWRGWCRDTATFLAAQDGVPIGIAAGVDGTSPDQRKLIAMWLHPGHRGSGASTALVAAVRSWSLRDDAATLMLWVTRSNHAAVKPYRRARFCKTGATKPLPSNPTLIEDQLVLDVR